MSRLPQLPEGFRFRRLLCPAGAIILGCLGFRFLGLAGKQGAYLEAVGPAILAVALLASAGILFVIPFAGTLLSPFTGVFERLFFPGETLRRPPEELLFALRMRLRDRYWESVDQQTNALIESYGPSPELYHLRALMEGGRAGNYSSVTMAASKKLSRRAFARYIDLLRNDPPPREIQTGIVA